MLFERDRGVCAICDRDTEADRYRLEGMMIVLVELYMRPFGSGRGQVRGSVHEAVYNQSFQLRCGRYWSDRHDVVYSVEEADRHRPVFTPIEYAPFLRMCRELKLSKPYGGQHLWEADHIVPVVEGGGECGIENYRTLCIACHRAETAKLAARRAVKRRGEKVAS
jgi:hypothetical protein